MTSPYNTARAAIEAETNPADPGDDTPLEVDALEFLDALIEAATLDGLGAAQYDAPIGDRLERTNKPWLGELEATGVHRRSEGGAREYRIYFGEPDIENLLLASFFAWKTFAEMNERVGATTRPKSSDKQSKHIQIAMDALMR